MAKRLKALFLGRKPAASKALRVLHAKSVDVVAVVAPDSASEVFWRPRLADTARELGIPVRTAGWLDGPEEERGRDGEVDLEGIDLVISFLYWRRIRERLIELPRIGCFNVHPGPLPDFRGRRGYNHAILEGCSRYGATIHWVSPGFDEGDLVEVRTFEFDPGAATALSLERATMSVMVDMFHDFVEACIGGREIARRPQGEGRTATKAELLRLMEVRPEDDAETVSRKARAFWYPPYAGATVEVGGRRFTLVDEDVLRRLGEFVHGSRDTPF